MIVDKKTGKLPSSSNSNSETEAVETEIVQVPSGGIIDAFAAVKEILSNVRWKYGDSHSPKIFNRVYLDDGQFERICKTGKNPEDGIAFPACFIHFVNIHWLKPSGSATEGRAELRIRYILNRLNIHDSTETESEGFYVGERIKQELVLHKDEYDALKERLCLDYFDQVNSFDKGLQPWWMNYEVYFRESNIWWERNITKVSIVFPPFANHSDQDKELNRFNHTNENHQITYDEASGFVYEGIEPDADDDTDSGDNSDDENEEEDS